MELKFPVLVDPFEDGELDFAGVAPGTTAVNDLRLEQADHRLGPGVVVRVTDCADRPVDARLGEAVGVFNRLSQHLEGDRRTDTPKKGGTSSALVRWNV